MTEPYIQFRNLSKRYQARLLFDIPEMDLQTGQCTILSGCNGSGKTTLLKIIAGLEAPDSGEVHYQGQAYPWQAARHRYQQEIIYLHQQAYMFNTSVWDNIAYGLQQQKMPQRVIYERVSQALAWADLEHLAQQNARKLSGGEKQRIALARAWVLRPRLLLLDETTANMDQASRARTHQQICRLKENGIGVVITSHDLDKVMSLADRHLCLENHTLQSRRQPVHSDSAFPYPAAYCAAR